MTEAAAVVLVSVFEMVAKKDRVWETRRTGERHSTADDDTNPTAQLLLGSTRDLI